MIQTNVIHCGECAEMMRQHLPDNSIDLTVTSPPYDNLRDYNGYTFDFEAIAQQLWRVTKPGGVVVWVVADATINGSETGTSFRQALRFMEIGFNIETMIYQKDGTSAAGNMDYYLQAFEFMFVFSKGKPKTINILRDRKNKKSGVTNPQPGRRSISGNLKKDPAYKVSGFGRRYNIWLYNAGNATFDNLVSDTHPAIFPEALARDHIISWSNPGDIVFDPMCGSGTTLKMAVEQGRQYIGIDISPEYCELSAKRVGGARVPLPGLVAGKQPQPQQLTIEAL